MSTHLALINPDLQLRDMKQRYRAQFTRAFYDAHSKLKPYSDWPRMARCSECTGQCAQRVLDAADIVREATLLQTAIAERNDEVTQGSASEP